MILLKDHIIKQVTRQQKMYMMSVETGMLPSILGDIAQDRGMSLAAAAADYETDIIDLSAVKAMATAAQTVIFSADQAIYLRPLLHRFEVDPVWDLPYPNMVIQFDRPIPERDFFQIEPEHWVNKPEWRELIKSVLGDLGELWFDPAVLTQGDAVLGIVLSNEAERCTAAAYFASGEIQRTAFTLTDLDVSKGIAKTNSKREGGIENKRQLMLIAQSIVFYLNMKNVYLEKIEVGSRRIRERRAKKKMPPLPEYFVTQIRKTKTTIKYTEETDKEPEDHKQGTPHDHIYDVGGHPRKLADGSGSIWVQGHQRGLNSGGPYIPRVYKVNKDKVFGE